MPNDKKKAMIRTRNCLMKSVSVVRVFVCVFERVAITLFYFSAVPTKLSIRDILLFYPGRNMQ